MSRTIRYIAHPMVNCLNLVLLFLSSVSSMSLTGCSALVSSGSDTIPTAGAPSITAQPANQTVTAGQTATFAVAATGTAPLNYRWMKSGAAISGATSSSYTTPATTSSDNGAQFSVMVSNATGSVTSSPATLTVTAGPVAPTITTQPTNQTVTAGQTATFTVVAGGTAPLSYQWQKSGANIAGATSSSYTTPATTTSDSGSTFDVVVTNSAGSITSNPATLTVSAGAVAPSITTQPANQTVTAGQTARFTVTAAGTAPLSYQWQKSGANIAGATSSSYTTPATTTSDSGSTFDVVVTNSAGSITSNLATLTVNAATTPPSVPTGLTATAASSSQINLTWNASTDSSGTLAGYKVYRGGSQIGTSPNTAYQDSGLAASTTYSYTVAAYDTAGNTSAQSASASATTPASSGGGGGGIPPALGWYQIPNTTLQPLCPPYPEIQGLQGCAAVVASWSGGMFDTKRNRLIIFGGGHNAYYGNEIYAIDLNANPIAAVLVHDAAHGSAIANLSSCPDAYSDGTPDSRHTYDGEWYLPNQDKYFIYGGAKAPCGYLAASIFLYDASNNTWAQQNITGSQPNPPSNGSMPYTAYDPVTGNLYEAESNGGVFWSYTPGSSSWNNLANTNACNPLNMTTAIDPGRRLYFCVGNGNFQSISLNAPYTSSTLNGTGCSNLVGTAAPGFTYDPVQKLMVGWAGGNTAYIYNPDTDSCTAATYPGGPTTIQATGTYGRFQYSPTSGVFIVVNDITLNAYTLRLTAQ